MCRRCYRNLRRLPLLPSPPCLNSAPPSNPTYCEFSATSYLSFHRHVFSALFASHDRAVAAFSLTLWETGGFGQECRGGCGAANFVSWQCKPRRDSNSGSVIIIIIITSAVRGHDSNGSTTRAAFSRHGEL